MHEKPHESRFEGVRDPETMDSLVVGLVGVEVADLTKHSKFTQNLS